MDSLASGIRKLKAVGKNVRNAVMNIGEMEQKVREATSDEKWGASGTLMHEICDGISKNREDYDIVMTIMWKRLQSENWRRVYKALTLLDFLLKHGTRKLVDDVRDHQRTIRRLTNFQFVEEDTGRDQGLNVREKAKKLIELLSNNELLEEERDKCKKNREKIYENRFGGISSEDRRYRSSYSSSYDRKKTTERKPSFDRGTTERARKKSDDYYAAAPSRPRKPSFEGKKDTKSEEPKFTKALGLSGESTAKKQPQATESRQSSLLNFDDDDAFDPRGTAAKSAAPEKSAPSASFDAFGDAFGSSGAPSASADFGGFSGFGAAAQPQQPAADLFSSAAPANGSGADLLGGASNTGSSSFPSLMDDMMGAPEPAPVTSNGSGNVNNNILQPEPTKSGWSDPSGLVNLENLNIAGAHAGRKAPSASMGAPKPMGNAARPMGGMGMGGGMSAGMGGGFGQQQPMMGGGFGQQQPMMGGGFGGQTGFPQQSQAGFPQQQGFGAQQQSFGQQQGFQGGFGF